MRWLSQEHIQSLITMKEVIELMKQLFPLVTKGQVTMPERAVVELAEGRDSVLFMPAYLPDIQGLGVKIVSIFPNNPSRELPTISAKILLNDPDTGEIVCIMDGSTVTALRTAAVSALATDILSLRHAQSLTIFGSGVQGRSHINAIMEIRPVRKVYIYDIDNEKALRLTTELNRIHGKACLFQAVNTPDEAVTNSQIIVTATTSETPVFNGNMINPGTHINAVGSFKPHIREVDDLTIRNARIFVDSYELALKEGGDLIIPMEKGIIGRKDIQAELGELVLGTKKGRISDKEITFFKSVGMAAEDISVAKRVWEKAEQSNLGTDIGPA